ncbi:charged multivesicular body protein 7 [Spea bombifrons]|uniref:charged multivesicular body protein 7 n=1 Tax=Spea bombifrons TaxID=233779 RepID=UPI00234A0C16|nr:charged multivesicular body protein 7 [Spea bombifrons]
MTPVEPFPPDWDDDERMSFLFSAFKQSRDVNTSDWDGKMGFWVPLILRHARSKGLFSVTLRDLQVEFTRKGSVPLGLGTVIQEMIRQGSLQKESHFVSGVSSGWLVWGMQQLVIRPLRWTVGAVLGLRISPDEPLLVPEVIKDGADMVLKKYQSSSLSSMAVLSEEDVRSLCADVCPSPSALNLVLLQLQRDKKICVMEKGGEKLVKFVQAGMGHVTAINQSDVGIYELRKSEKLLSERLQSACTESDRLKEEALSSKHAGNKQQALRCLRRRKLAEKRATELQNKLDTVQNILERISMAETDRKVISAYEVGVSALRLAMKDVSQEKAESLVDQIQEFCDLQDDINQTLSGAVISDTDIDVEDLERELDDILKQEEVLIDLPDVPTNPITPQQPVTVQDDGDVYQEVYNAVTPRAPATILQ